MVSWSASFKIIVFFSVHLVELKGTGELYAMKAMEKSTMLNRNKVQMDKSPLFNVTWTYYFKYGAEESSQFWPWILKFCFFYTSLHFCNYIFIHTHNVYLSIYFCTEDFVAKTYNFTERVILILIIVQVHRACIEREIISFLDHPFLPTLYTSFQVIHFLNHEVFDLRNLYAHFSCLCMLCMYI